MTFLEPSYELTLVPDEPNPTPLTINEKLTLFNGMLTGTYNILKGPVTPFVDLTAGWTHVDSNVTDRPPVTGCWWDPWWGYICRSYWSTYSDTSFSYGGGLGVRWDISSAIFMRASYNMLRIDGGSDPTLGHGPHRNRLASLSALSEFLGATIIFLKMPVKRRGGRVVEGA